MESFRRDLRYAIAGFLKHPGFALTAMSILAIGIGAMSVMFSVVNTVLLQPLPYPDPGTLVAIWENSGARGSLKETPAPANYFDWRAQNTSFVDIAAYNRAAMILTGGEPEELVAHRVTAGFFPTFGVAPL